MTSFPKALTRLPSTFIHMAGIPACFMAASMLYEPKALTELLRAGGFRGGQTFIGRGGGGMMGPGTK